MDLVFTFTIHSQLCTASHQPLALALALLPSMDLPAGGCPALLANRGKCCAT